MKPILLFDIDRTLIDTDTLRRKITAALVSKLGVSRKKFLFVEKEYFKNLKHSHDFSPDGYIGFLANNFGNRTVIREIFFKKDFYQNSLYPDVKKTLEGLKENFQLGIYSEGRRRFQMAKIILSGIDKYFNPNLIFIYRRKLNKEAVDALPNNSTIIDDNLEVVKCLAINNKKKFLSILIDRKSKYKKIGFLRVKVIKNLFDLLFFLS